VSGGSVDEREIFVSITTTAVFTTRPSVLIAAASAIAFENSCRLLISAEGSALIGQQSSSLVTILANALDGA
jgi:hypothetical protein